MSSNDDWIWSTTPCEMESELIDKQNEVIIGHKQWYNRDGVLSIDMMYTMNEVGLYRNAGIVLYFDEKRCDTFIMLVFGVDIPLYLLENM